LGRLFPSPSGRGSVRGGLAAATHTSRWIPATVSPSPWPDTAGRAAGVACSRWPALPPTPSAFPTAGSLPLVVGSVDGSPGERGSGDPGALHTETTLYQI